LGGDGLFRALQPALIDACGGPDRLRDVRWFRSVHQRGGGGTALATFSDDHGAEHPVVVKLPVGSHEYRWTVELALAQANLSDDLAATPRVLAHGRTLGDHDFAWLVMERLPTGLSPAQIGAQDVRDMLTSAARLERVARDLHPLSGADAPARVDFEKLMVRSREVIHRGVLVAGTEAQHWVNELKAVHRALPMLLQRWQARQVNAWCHGDLHAGNAMRRAGGAMVLIDLAMMHPGHWIEDALYLERTGWGREGALGGVSPVTELSLHRRELGLPCDDDYGRLACVRRVLTAACVPALIEREGSRAYLHAAYEVIRKNLSLATH
jgi:aminoglycoside phosphotransferase (APT) family kinase protein